MRALKATLDPHDLMKPRQGRMTAHRFGPVLATPVTPEGSLP